MTVYYEATGAPEGGKRGISEAVRAEFELIEAAFAALGPPGSTALSLQYKFSTTTTAADPGAGYLRLNHATAASATEAYIDLVDTNGVTQTDLLAVLGASTSTVKSYMRIVKVDDTTVHRTYSVSALATPSGYRTPTITHVSGAGVFAQDDDIYIEIARTGDKGDTGTNTTPLTYTARTADTQLTAADFASSTRISLKWTSGTFSQTIVAAATVGANGWLPFHNSGTGIITIDPNGEETINGASTQKVYPGESGILVCDGTGFYTLGLAPRGTPLTLSTATASSSATVDFTLNPDFDDHIIIGRGVRPATDAASINVRTSTDGGSTYDSTAGHYDYGGIYLKVSSTPGTVGATGASAIQMTEQGTSNGLGNLTDEMVHFTLRIFKPAAAAYCHMLYDVSYTAADGDIRKVTGSALRKTAADVTNIRIYCSSGNISVGDFEYQVAKK